MKQGKINIYKDNHKNCICITVLNKENSALAELYIDKSDFASVLLGKQKDCSINIYKENATGNGKIHIAESDNNVVLTYDNEAYALSIIIAANSFVDAITGTQGVACIYEEDIKELLIMLQNMEQK